MGAKKTPLGREIEELTKAVQKIQNPILRKLVIQLIAAMGMYYAERQEESARRIPPR